MTDKLITIQNELNVPKNRHNSFGNYSYRSLEDILEAVKPLLQREGLLLTITDTIEQVGDNYYVKATARLTDGNQELQTTAYAQESQDRKGMDPAQRSGASSSYARKYCLNALFLIDDTKDPDTDEYKMKENHDNKAYIPDENKKWLSEGGDGVTNTTSEEFERVSKAVESGKITPKQLRNHYKVSKSDMEYFEGLVK
jgi:hypothetical protein